MPPTLQDEAHQKNSRKIKRLRDASCMRKRETKQDRWGRQRGGRRARWDKLDRQPSALKSRLRLVHSAAAAGGRGIGEDALFDAAEEAFAFGDLATTVPVAVDAAKGEGVPDAAPPAGGSNERGVGAVSGGGGADGDAAEIGVENPSPNRSAQHAREDVPPRTPTPAVTAAEVGDADGAVPGNSTARSQAAEAAPPPPPPPQPATAAAGAVSTPLSYSGTRGNGSSSSSSSSSRAKTGGSGGGRRTSLRSPGGLSRGSSMGGGVGGGLGSGSYRGSPPPLHRRLSSPAGVGSSSKKGHKQRQGGSSAAGGTSSRSGSGLGSAKKKRQGGQRSIAGQQGGIAEEEEVEAATPPPPPSLFDSVFKDKLPSLTPRKAPPATPRLSRDSIVHAIFQSLFGKRKVRSGPRERYGGDWDDVDEEEDEDDGEEEEVDESWIKTGINLTLFNSKAVDFACRSTAGADLLHQYVDSNAVFRLVTDLRFEDPRVPSPRLMIIKAVYENCAHLRLPTLRALAHASHDHLMRTRELEDWAARTGVDIAEAAAAAVADGVSTNGAGGGMGGGGGGRARVIGRDQSQTLVELLLFVLETFPRYFLGMVTPEEAWAQQQQQQQQQQGGFEAAFHGDGSSFNGDGGWVGGDFVVPLEASTGANGSTTHGDWNGGDDSSSAGFAGQGTEEEQLLLLQAGMAAGGHGLDGPFDSTTEELFDPSLDAAAAAASQCRSPTPTPYQPPPPPPPAAAMGVADRASTSEDWSTSGRDVSGGAPESEIPALGEREIARDTAVDENGLCSDGDGGTDGTEVGHATPRKQGGSAESRASDGGGPGGSGGGTDGIDAEQATPQKQGGSAESRFSDEGGPGGGVATAGGAASPGGDPAVASSDGCSPARPSPGKKSPPSAGQLGGRADSHEPPWSPAWATAGVRSLEDNPSEESERVAPGGAGGSGGDGVWGQGMASKDLVWGSSAAGAAVAEAGEGGGDVSAATKDAGAGAGAARALRFTAHDEGEDDAADAAVDGHTEGPAAATAAAVQQPYESAGAVAAGGLGSEEWPTVEEASTPEKKTATVERVAHAEDARASTTGASSAAAGGEGAGQLQQPLPPATPTTAGAAAGGPSPEIDLPSLALREAARSLCNLYASHGAPAAGAEAAAGADAPERLQPLAVAGSTLCQLWPPASALLLRRLLGRWPAGSARREVAYLRLIAGIACAAPPLGVVCPGSRLPLMLFRRLARCINSSNTKVAQEAAFLVQADFILMVYLAPNRNLMDLITNALCANREHWSADVRNASDQTFDLMLDFL